MRAKTLITVNCPKCGVDTTVIKNGKGKYLCKNCKVYFREKKNLYPTEIKKLAVAMHGLGISYRVICVLLELGNHRNTVCYWIDKHKADKEIINYPGYHLSSMTEHPVNCTPGKRGRFHHHTDSHGQPLQMKR